MLIGILKETTAYEKRVAITSDGVKKLISSGHKVCIQSGAGDGSFISDEE